MRILSRLKGWRTLLWSLLLATIGVLETLDFATLLPDTPARGFTLIAIAFVTAWLRVVTDTPVGVGAQ
jgi:hypothetical protein